MRSENERKNERRTGLEGGDVQRRVRSDAEQAHDDRLRRSGGGGDDERRQRFKRNETLASASADSVHRSTASSRAANARASLSSASQRIAALSNAA